VQCAASQAIGSTRSQADKKQTPWPKSASELYRPSDRRMSVKLVTTFADRGCHVVSVTNLYGRILGFLDRSPYFFIQVALQLFSRGCVDPVAHPLLLIKSGSAGNLTRASASVAKTRPSTRPQRRSYKISNNEIRKSVQNILAYVSSLLSPIITARY
jgi:hypothetical protein